MKGWKTKKLGELCEIELGRTPSRGNPKYWDEKRESGNVWFSISDLLNAEDGLVFDSKEYVSDEGAKLCKTVRKGTLLVSFKLTLGRLAFAGRDLFTNEAISALTLLDKDELSKEFLFWCLHHFDWNKAAENDVKLKGMTLNKAKLKEISISFPPLPEQRRIVGILDEAFAAIATAKANVEKNLRNARELFESCLSTVLADIDGRWSTWSLEDVVTDDCSLSYGIVQPGDDVEDGLPVVRPVDLTMRVIGLDGLKRINPARASAYRRTTLSGGELLLCVRGSTGAMAVASSDLKGANVTRGIVPIRFKATLMDPEFGYYLFRSKRVQDQIRAGTYGVALMQINIRDLRRLTLVFPSVVEQRRLVQTLTGAEAHSERLATLYQQKLAALDALKKSLLHQAFSRQLTREQPAIVVEAKSLTPFPITIPAISTTDLHAGILAMAYQKHEARGKTQHFGHVKAEKIADVVERYLGIALGRNPVKDRFGPNDFTHLKKVEHRARMTNAFDFQRVEDSAYRVRTLRGFDRLIGKARAALGDRLAEVEALLNLMLPMDRIQAEVFATVYAGWNNLLIEGITPTDEEIVVESRENWHPEKLKIPRDRFFKAIKFLRDNGMVPHGRGAKVLAKGETDVE